MMKSGDSEKKVWVSLLCIGVLICSIIVYAAEVKKESVPAETIFSDLATFEKTLPKGKEYSSFTKEGYTIYLTYIADFHAVGFTILRKSEEGYQLLDQSNEYSYDNIIYPNGIKMTSCEVPLSFEFYVAKEREQPQIEYQEFPFSNAYVYLKATASQSKSYYVKGGFCHLIHCSWRLICGESVDGYKERRSIL